MLAIFRNEHWAHVVPHAGGPEQVLQAVIAQVGGAGGAICPTRELHFSFPIAVWRVEVSQ